MAFGILDTEIILRLLARAEQAAGASAPRIVLIGGQAVNFWAELYRSREPDLQEGPFTSKDVDFQAARATVDWVAQALGVKASKPSKDHATEQTGKIVFTMPNGETCEIDILRRSIPNLEQDVIDRAVPATLSDGSSFWVMHPLHCMFSRVHNVIELGGKYNNEHGRAQLRASVICLRLFTLELAQTDLRELSISARKCTNTRKETTWADAFTAKSRSIPSMPCRMIGRSVTLSMIEGIPPGATI